MQHEGKKIQGQAHYIKSGSLHHALQELLTAIKTEQCPVNLVMQGVTEESRLAFKDYSQTDSYHRFIEETGFLPTQANVNRAFQEYKKEIRGGSVGEDENGRMIYPQDRPHFIEGSVKDAQGNNLSFQGMTPQEWMHASGMLKFFLQRHWNQHRTVDALIGNELEKPLTATLPAPLTDSQLAYAVQAGTVPHHERHRLTTGARRDQDKRANGQQHQGYFFSWR
jgi:hypothetical protein